MTSEQFAFWLQGFFELSNSDTLSKAQVRVIRDHLTLIFDKQTPDYSFQVDVGDISTKDTSDLIEEWRKRLMDPNLICTTTC